MQQLADGHSRAAFAKGVLLPIRGCIYLRNGLNWKRNQLKMRIVVIQDYLRDGGTEKHSVFLANYFDREGHQSTLLTFRPKGSLDARLQAQHVALQPFDTRLDSWAPLLQPKLRALEPDVVLLMGGAANLKLRAVKEAVPAAKVVATLRTGTPPTQAYADALRHADAVVANSHWALQRAAGIGVAPERLHCINNGFGRHWNPDQKDYLRQQIRADHGVGAQTLVLIQVAAFRPGRGQRRLLEALAVFAHDFPQADWQLWLLGSGPTQARVRRRARELGLEDRVAFLGHQRHTYEYLCGADICVFASESESQPSALIEAQWAGLPVVSYDVGGAAECFLPEQSGYLVASADTRRFSERLGALAQDAGLREQMGRAGSAHARTHFDPQRQAHKYLDLFQQLAGSPSRES